MDYVGGAADDGSRQRVEEHLDGCDLCRRLVSEALVAMVEAPDATTALFDDIERTEEDTPFSLGEQTPPSEPLLPGTMVDHYRVESMIGLGGMGQVYRATDTQLGRMVALKLIRTDRAVQELGPRFLFEARATARFSHPNIVAIYGVGEFDGQPYIALEHVPGEPLSMRLKRAPLSPKELAGIAHEIASALQEAHRHGIVHRDLKPGNVIVGQDGRTRVLDFGVAKLVRQEVSVIRGYSDLQQDAAMTTTHGIRGTPRFMAPEQWIGEELTPAVDIWALGLILHMMRWDALPSDQQDVATLMSDTTGAGPVSIRVSDPPDAVDAMVQRCLDKDPRRRPAAEEVASFFAADDSWSTIKAVAGARRTRRRVWPLVAIAAAVLVIASSALVLVARRGSNGPGPLARRPAVDATVQQADLRQAARVDSRVQEATTARIKPAPKKAERRRNPRKRRRTRRAGRAVLIVQSQLGPDPMWANVFVDGRYRGQTPLRLAVRSGSHDVKISRRGFRPQRRRVKLGRGATSRVRFALTR